MTAEKIVKMNSEYEADMLREKLNVYESVIDYSVAEQMLSLKNKVRDLENEAIALRAADKEKDKLIDEKDKRINTMRTSYEKQLDNKLEWQRKQFELEKKQSLSDQRKNIRQREIKPKEEIVEKSKEEVNRVQTMYKSLLNEFSQVNEKLDTQTGLLYTILDILNNSNNINEAKDEIDEAITETKTALGIKYTDTRKPTSEEKIQLENEILELYNNGMSNKEIALKLFNDNNIWFVGMQSKNAMEQKVGRYIKSAKKRLSITDEKKTSKFTTTLLKI